MTSEATTEVKHLTKCPHDGNTRLVDCGKGDHCNACGCCFNYGEANLRPGHSACLQADHKGQAMSLDDLNSQVQRLSKAQADADRLATEVTAARKSADAAAAAAAEATRQNGILLAKIKEMDPEAKTDDLLAKPPESPEAPANRSNLPPQLR